MKFGEFLQQLSRHPDQELVFEFEQQEIHSGYHLTEVLSHRIEAIDCGGAVDRWAETVLQLVEPRHADGERFMSAAKALQILNQSAAHIALDPSSDTVLEFRPSHAAAAQHFHVAALRLEGERVRVLSTGSRTQCKAAVRAPAGCCEKRPGAAACCAPGTAPQASRAAWELEA